MGATLNNPSSVLVSVVMPVVRVDDYVAPAIKSVFAQQGVSVELILIGPQESDPAYAQLQNLIGLTFSNDSRCVLIPRYQQGIAHALNQGLNYANGDYIARMDADDLCEPNRLRIQLDTAQRYNDHCLVAACVKIFSDQDSVLQGNQHYETWLNDQRTPPAIRNACFVESPLPHPTWFAHKSIWDTLGPYQQGDFPEDYDRVLNAWLQNIPMVKPEPVLLHWREHTNRLTRTDKRYRREAFIQLKAKTLADSRSELGLDKGRAVWIAGTGRNARYWHDALLNNNAMVAGFVDLDHAVRGKQKRHKPVVSYKTLLELLNDDLLVTAITNTQARNQLMSWCDEHHLSLSGNVILGG